MVKYLLDAKKINHYEIIGDKMEIIIKEDEIKSMLEDIIFKLFQEKKEIFRDIVEEVIEDIALCKAIEDGRKNEFVSQEKIMEILNR